jgi:hypothetical protein
VKRIGDWAFQPGSRSWKLDGQDMWLIRLNVLSSYEAGRRHLSQWCHRCLFQYGRSQAWNRGDHRYNYQRWRLYKIPPQPYVEHDRRRCRTFYRWVLETGWVDPDRARLSRIVPAGLNLETGWPAELERGRVIPMPEVCDHVTHRIGWCGRPPQQYPAGSWAPLGEYRRTSSCQDWACRHPREAHGQCMHTPYLREAMELAKRVLAEDERQLAEAVVKSLAELGGTG